MTDRTSARQDPTNFIVSKGPDVCWTPRGGGMERVPYTSVACLANAVRVSKSVRDNGNYDFQINSRAPSSTGNEPGTGKGVKVPGYCGMALAEKGAHFEYSEGWSSVCHRAPAWINRPGPGMEEQQKSMLEKSEFMASTSQESAQKIIPGSVAKPMQADKFVGKAVDARDLEGVRKAKETANGSAVVVANPAVAPLRPPYNYDKALPPDEVPRDWDAPDGPTDHHYHVPPYKICSSTNPACNVQNVRSAVLATQVPGYDGPTKDGGIYPVKIPVMGYIGNVKVYDDGMSVTNETLRGHLLYYGEITRTITKEKDGIYLSVEGRGRNSTNAVADVNQFFGPRLFQTQDGLTKGYFDSHFGAGK